MGTEDGEGKIVRGRIPWKGKRIENPRVIVTGKDTFDFSEFDQHLAAANRRAEDILKITVDCDLKEAERLRDYFLNKSDFSKIASYILGSSGKDIEAEPISYRGASLALKRLQELE